ncbi:MAG: hypothetical protein AAGA56_01795 [Myxococcota bacterium]
MKSQIVITIASVGVAAVAALFPAAEGEAAVQTTKPDCITAWALLAPGSDTGKEAVRSVVRNNPHWKADGYEPMKSQHFDLQVFPSENRPNGVIVAHCGHGATCNALATEVNKKFPNLTHPTVHCTQEPPQGLTGGEPMGAE